ncbi:unnamed protein product, partial [Ectocarpus sp. 13 AM-2016]
QAPAAAPAPTPAPAPESRRGRHDVKQEHLAVQTVRFKNELERNITIKLGYANAKIFKAVEGAVPGPGNFR